MPPLQIPNSQKFFFFFSLISLKLFKIADTQTQQSDHLITIFNNFFIFQIHLFWTVVIDKLQLWPAEKLFQLPGEVALLTAPSTFQLLWKYGLDLLNFPNVFSLSNPGSFLKTSYLFLLKSFKSIIPITSISDISVLTQPHWRFTAIVQGTDSIAKIFISHQNVGLKYVGQ